MNTQGAARKVSIVQSGLRRPSWICQNVQQKAILVRDRSGSMSGQKAKDASAASLDLVEELAQPSNKDGFLVGVVDSTVRSRLSPSAAASSAEVPRTSPPALRMPRSFSTRPNKLVERVCSTCALLY
jgi:hypothetical protein